MSWYDVLYTHKLVYEITWDFLGVTFRHKAEALQIGVPKKMDS